MATLKRPHEYVVDRATKQTTITKVNPTLRFGSARELVVGVTMTGEKILQPNPDYHPPITWQNGRYYLGEGDAPDPLPAAQVPAAIRTLVAAFVERAQQGALGGQIQITLEDAEAIGRGHATAPAAPPVVVTRPPQARAARRAHRRPAPRRAIPSPPAAVAAEG